MLMSCLLFGGLLCPCSHSNERCPDSLSFERQLLHVVNAGETQLRGASAAAATGASGRTTRKRKVRTQMQRRSHRFTVRQHASQPASASKQSACMTSACRGRVNMHLSMNVAPCASWRVTLPPQGAG
jgi:hypothetical protein